MDVLIDKIDETNKNIFLFKFFRIFLKNNYIVVVIKLYNKIKI